jgi:ZIP family zinc transporter
LEASFNTYALAFGLTLFAGLSTAVGAVIAFFSKSKNTNFLSIGLGFSAGVMIFVSFMEIIPKSQDAFSALGFEKYADALALLFFFVGIGVTAFIDRIIPQDVNPHEPKSRGELSVLKPENKHSILHSNLHRTGLFTALAITIHNFPEGFATFVASIDDLTLGLTIAFAIAIHNIPEGMAVSLPIYHATGNKKKAFYYAAGSGLAEPLGAVIGFFLLLPLMGEATLGIIFATVAGIMIYISFDELLPSARVYGNEHTTIGGIVLGMFVMGLSLLFI